MKKNLIKILFLILCLFGYTNVCAKTPLYGDANGDGRVNSEDLSLIQKYIADWKVTINKRLADVNLDGVVNFDDLGLLQQYLSGWDVKLPTKKVVRLYGDLNLDNKVDYKDYNLLLYYYFGYRDLTNDVKVNADMNSDGKIDYNDLSILYNKVRFGR